METTYDQLRLNDNAAQKHLELQVEGHTAFIEYKVTNQNLFLIHTEVPEALRGKGVGSAIVEKALQFAKDNNYKIVPLCHFVQDYIKEHDEWQSMVATNAKRYIE